MRRQEIDRPSHALKLHRADRREGRIGSVRSVDNGLADEHLAGARVLELFPIVSLLGNLTLIVAVLSYAGQLTLTAAADRDTCSDVEVFVEGVQDTLDALSRPLLAPAS